MEITGTNFDIDSIIKILMSVLDAPSWKLIATAVVFIIIGFLYIAKYFFDKNKREEEAYKRAKEIEKKENEIVERMQRDAAKAQALVLDASKKQDLVTIQAFIDQDNDFMIYNKFSKVYHKQIAEILIKDELTSVEKAERIIYVVY